MITCARCGQALQAAMSNCPNCGALNPLAAQAAQTGGNSTGNQGMPDWMRGIQSPPGVGGPMANGARATTPAQPPDGAVSPQGMFSVGQLISEDALPDWVRNADEAGASPAAASPPGGWGTPPPGATESAWPDPGPAPMGQMSAAALFDDAALPEWLRAAADRQPLDSRAPGGFPTGAPAGVPYGGMFGDGANQPPAPPYTAFPGAPAPGQPYQEPVPGGMSAQSLLDASALPTWLGGDGQAPEAAVSAGPLGGGGLSANSLVDENALPEWMRQEPGQRPADAMPAAGTVSQWLASPVTDEPLPGFLDQVYASADVPRLEPASPWGTVVAPGGAMRLGAMGADQLVDPNALPEWLRGAALAQAAQPAPFGAPPPPPPGNGGYAFSAAPPPPPPPPGAGAFFSAADLIEPDALLAPESEGPAPASAAVFSPTSGWSFGDQARMSPAGSMQGVPGGNGYGNGMPGAPNWNPTGGNSAASLVDPNNLPEWLAPHGAQAADPMGAGGIPANGNGAGYGTRPSRQPIPDAELPEWLRGGAPASMGAIPSAYPAPDDAPPGAGAPAGYGQYGDYGDYGGYADAGPMDDGDATGHYADRFGIEMPGVAGQFGYEYDYGNPNQPGGALVEPGSDSNVRKRKRKGFFRRK